MKDVFEKAIDEINFKEFINKVEEQLDGDQIVKIVGIIAMYLLITKR